MGVHDIWNKKNTIMGFFYKSILHQDMLIQSSVGYSHALPQHIWKHNNHAHHHAVGGHVDLPHFQLC